MIGTIIWLIGVACAIWCVMDIFKKNISTAGKVIAAIVVLLTSWLGLAVYYFYGRVHLEEKPGREREAGKPGVENFPGYPSSGQL